MEPSVNTGVNTDTVNVGGIGFKLPRILKRKIRGEKEPVSFEVKVGSPGNSVEETKLVNMKVDDRGGLQFKDKDVWRRVCMNCAQNGKLSRVQT